MAGIKEIRSKIKSVQNTRKITKAMQMVASSKMRKAQDRMYAGRPYTEKVREIARHLMGAYSEYTHPFMEDDRKMRNVGIILVSTDKGLCGGLNTNLFRLVLARIKDFRDKGIDIKATAIGNKGLGFLNRLGIDVISEETQLGDAPGLEDLIGSIKVQVDAFKNGQIDAVYIATNLFINNMSQMPCFVRLLPLAGNLNDVFQKVPEEVEGLGAEADLQKTSDGSQYTWDYMFEPNAESVIDFLLTRYIEAVIYQAVNENIASEQSARMVAMKAASDNAHKVIGDLQLVYNKTRQAAITTEISEIVGGAAAV